MFKFIFIRKDAVGFTFYRGEFSGVLSPGRHLVYTGTFARVDLVHPVDTTAPRLVFAQLGSMVGHPALASRVEVVRVSDSQRALVWMRGCLVAILAPGLAAFWKHPELSIETFELGDFLFRHALLPVVMTHPDASVHLDFVRVDDGETARIFRDGAPMADVGPGLYATWKAGGRMSVARFPAGEQQLDLAGQELLTSDRVPLCVSLLVTWMVADHAKALAAHDIRQIVQHSAQMALRTLVTHHTLDRLLAERDCPCDVLSARLQAVLEFYGVRVLEAGLREVILSDEIRHAMRQVAVARLESEAQVIRRREEATAIRAQVQAAKVLAKNPHLLRLRELELMQAIKASA